MKRKLFLSTGFVLAIVVLVLGSTSITKAQQEGELIADTGVLTLGPTEVLRLTVVKKGGIVTGAINFTSAHRLYAEPVCSTVGSCKAQFIIVQQGANRITGDETLIFDVSPVHQGQRAHGVRGILYSDRPNKVVVTGFVMDLATGKTVGEITLRGALTDR